MVLIVLPHPLPASLGVRSTLLALSLVSFLALTVAAAARADVLTSGTAVAEAPDTTAAPGEFDGVMSPEELVAMADGVAQQVEELRGWPFKTPVPKNVRSEDELRDYMIASFEEDYPGDLPDRIGASLAMVGLLPPGTSLLDTMMEVLMNQVGGFYDPPTQAFYMVNRAGMSMPVAAMKIMVAHELTHALDDQYAGLEAIVDAYPRTEDSEFAAASVVEGSATILMTRYLTRLQLSGDLTMQDLTDLMESEAERSKPFLEAPAYFHTIMGRYTLGMLFLLRGDMGLVMSADAGKTVGERFLAAAANPPQSSEQILHPKKYWDDEARDLPVTVSDEAVEAILDGAGLSVLHRETFGEILIAITTRPDGGAFNLMNATSATAWTDSAAMGWGGDRFYLLGPKAGDGAESGAPMPPVEDLRGLWITAWDTPLDREEFTAAYLVERADLGPRVVLIGNRGAAVLFGFTDDEAAAVEKALLASPPGFAQGDESWMP